MVGVGGAIGGAIGQIGAALELQEEIKQGNTNNGRVGRKLCDAYANNPNAGALAASGVFGLNPSIKGLCSPYWDGPEGYTPPQEGSPPFSGGQCAGVNYIVTYAYDVRQGNPCGTESFGPFTRSKIGPIRGLRTASVGVECPCPGGGNGEVYLQSSTSSGGLAEELVASRAQDCIINARIVSVARADGAPDECGDPVPGPNVPSPNAPPVTYGTPTPITPVGGGPPVNITINAPVNDIDGDVYFPITTEFGDVNFSPTFDPPALPAPPEPPATLGDPQETGGASGAIADDIPPEEEEEGFETIGYKCQVLGIPSGFQRIPGTSPAIFPLVVGSLQLRLRTADGTIVFSDNLRITSEECSIIRQDITLKVIGVRWNHLPSLSGLRLTPIRGRRRNDS